MLNAREASASSDPVTLSYEADLLGNIQQALAGLQGFGVMALELIQNADDAGADNLIFDVNDAGGFAMTSSISSGSFDDVRRTDGFPTLSAARVALAMPS